MITTTYTSRIDILRRADLSVAHRLFLASAAALLTALAAGASVQIWVVPFTLQTLVVYGAGLLLGARTAFLGMMLYLVLGHFFPVFSGDGTGLVGRPTAGYLVGFPLAAAVIGTLSIHGNGFLGAVISVQAGSIVLFLCGAIGLHLILGGESWLESLYNGWFRFAPIDLVKILLVSGMYAGLRSLLRDAPDGDGT